MGCRFEPCRVQFLNPNSSTPLFDLRTQSGSMISAGAQSAVVFEADTIKIRADMTAVSFSLFSSNQVFALSTKSDSALSAPDRMMGPTILQQVSHPIVLLLIGMQSCLTDPKPRRENSSGSLLPMYRSPPCAACLRPFASNKACIASDVGLKTKPWSSPSMAMTRVGAFLERSADSIRVSVLPPGLVTLVFYQRRPSGPARLLRSW